MARRSCWTRILQGVKRTRRPSRMRCWPIAHRVGLSGARGCRRPERFQNAPGNRLREAWLPDHRPSRAAGCGRRCPGSSPKEVETPGAIAARGCGREPSTWEEPRSGRGSRAPACVGPAPRCDLCSSFCQLHVLTFSAVPPSGQVGVPADLLFVESVEVVGGQGSVSVARMRFRTYIWRRQLVLCPRNICTLV